MRKSPGHISWVLAFGFYIVQRKRLNLYKIESALESDKWCLSGEIKKMVQFFENSYRLYTERTKRRNKKRQFYWDLLLLLILL
jgi:hypothetical protein